MKHTTFLSILSMLFFLAPIMAQNNSDFRFPKKEVLIWVTLKNDMGLYEGYLHSMSTEQLAYKNELLSAKPSGKFLYEDIEVIRYRRKGSLGRTIGWGTLAGTAIGSLMGISHSGDDSSDSLNFDDSFDVAIGAIMGGLAGLTTGLIFGNSRRTATINGEHSPYLIFGGQVLAKPK